jgi:hypothetical protein
MIPMTDSKVKDFMECFEVILEYCLFTYFMILYAIV